MDTSSFFTFFQEGDEICASCYRMQKCLGQKLPCIVGDLPDGFYNFDQLDMQVDFKKKKTLF